MDSNIPANELTQILENAIEQLPEQCRLVFRLREIASMTVRETADTLHIPEVEVNALLTKAKVMLPETLHGYLKSSVNNLTASQADRIVHYVMHYLGIKDA